MGNIQLVNPLTSALRLAVHHGFKKPSGIIIGVLSTHYRASRGPTDIERAHLDALVWGSVEMIEAAPQLA